MGKAKKETSNAAGISLRTNFVRTSDTSFSGYVFDPAEPSRHFAVELFLDGLSIKLTRAEILVAELTRESIGDGRYGFAFSLSPSLVTEGGVIQARVANTGFSIGTPIALGQATDMAPSLTNGGVRWLGGLRFDGWCTHDPNETPQVNVLIDGASVASTEALGWTNVGSFDNVRAVRSFSLHLPERFADGHVRRARFVLADGRELPSSPLTFVAFKDGLARTLDRLGGIESERLRGELYDRLLPQSVPFSTYARWRNRFPLSTSHTQTEPIAIVLIGPGDESASVASIEVQDHSDWLLAALPERDSPVQFEADLLRDFVEGDAAKCNLFLFTLTGTRLLPNALSRVTEAFAATLHETAVAFGDFDVAVPSSPPPIRGTRTKLPDIEPSQEVWPIALSAFDHERLLEQGYCAHLFALRRQLLDTALKAGASDLYRLFNASLECSPGLEIIHIPGALGTLPPIDTGAASRTLAAATAAHLKASGITAKIVQRDGTLLPAVRVMRKGNAAPVTIVIPVRDKPALLRSCLESIDPAVRSERAEIIVVDNDSSDPEMLEFLEELSGRNVLVLPVPGEFNFARLNNIAAEKAHTEFLCLLNNDVKALDRAWLHEMLERMEPNVGAVGALLLWPSGVVQHGGVVLGPSFAATHAFNDRIEADPGYADLLRVAHETSSVTAACLVTRRQDFRAVGGMDEVSFPINFNDVDYCLKLRAAGKRIIFTPHARLLHFESASRGADTRPDRAARFHHELSALRARWGEHLLSDPYYNPILSLDPIPFSALAWPPRDMAPRRNEKPVPRQLPPGF